MKLSGLNNSFLVTVELIRTTYESLTKNQIYTRPLGCRLDADTSAKNHIFPITKPLSWGIYLKLFEEECSGNILHEDLFLRTLYVSCPLLKF